MDVQNTRSAFGSPGRFGPLNELKSSAGMKSPRDLIDALNFSAAMPAKLAEAVENQAQNQPTDRAFANLMDKAIEANPAPAETAVDDPRTKMLREKAEILVNKFFVGTMLKQMRDSPFKSEMFSGGKGGEAYQGMMDQHIAEHAGSRIAKSLVNTIVKSWTKPVADPEKLFIDPKQQKNYEEYKKSQQKNPSHELAASISA